MTVLKDKVEGYGKTLIILCNHSVENGYTANFGFCQVGHTEKQSAFVILCGFSFNDEYL